MKNLRTGLWLAGLVAVATGVIAADETKANLQLTMLTKVNPNALALWDATNKAQDDNGNLDPKKLNADAWSRIVDMGKAIEEGGKALASSNGVIAAAPGAKLQDESNPGASKAADVQRYLNAKPAEFRKHALELQKTGAGIVEAATKHDGKKLAGLSDSLDEVCESCHTIFWYPQQNGGK
jgi:hypothetical protein